MWLVLLILFAIKSVQPATIGYPYRSLWTYNPVKSGSIHGYLRYLDNNGPGGLVGYNNPQPVYAVRQIKYMNSAAPTLDTFSNKDNSDEIIKARETYLRAASLQQYQNLKSDIDALRANGKEPSAEKLLKLQMLEKISFTTDFSLIADLPEVRSTLQDLESSISGLYKDSVQQSSNEQANVAQTQGEIKTYVGNSNIPLVAIEETAEQKQARENHLRIYNEQIAHLKQLELEHQKYVQETSSKSNILPIVKQIDNGKALAEWERAQQEHFRLWNEAKLRAEQAGYGSGEKGVHDTADKQQISALKNDQIIYHPKQTIPKIQNPVTQTTQGSAEPTKQFEQQSLKSAMSTSEHSQKFNDQAKLKNEQGQIDHYTSEQRHIVDTPEVVRAREEHLRIVNEAILKGQADAELEQKQGIKSGSKEEKAKIYSDSLSQTNPIAESLGLKGSSSALNYRAEQSSIEDTPEVKKAREEHLRLVQEANLRAQFVEQQELKYKHESQIPILKAQYEHQQLAYHPAKSQNLQETPEVAKVREGQLRVVNEANEQNEKRIVSTSQPRQQQSSETQIIGGETSEVQRAREEHLRIFNSIKTHAEAEQGEQNSRIFPHPTSPQKPILDYAIEEERLLELERLREAERLQKEQQLLELDRLREAERLAEEKRQMEAELARLRLEEEQRLELERLLEDRRLQQEQVELRKLQNGDYQEIIIQNDSYDQQPQIAITSNSNIEQARSQQNTELVEQQSQHYANNPFLKDGQVPRNSATNPFEHSVSQQSSFPKTVSEQAPSNTYQHNYLTSPHHSGGGKHQYIKYYYHDPAISQPADTAVALIALEKATNDHFRAHELALEQLRLARIQNPVATVKDCN